MDYTTVSSFINEYAISVISLLALPAITIYAAVHAILYKRDSQAAAAWVGLIILAPIVGVILYWLLGINRARLRAIKIFNKTNKEAYSTNHKGIKSSALESLIAKVSATYPVRYGNEINPLLNGEQAYPEMINSIKHAKKTLVLCTYIFDNDSAGELFAKEIKEAAKRGVKCKILIDAVGARYSFPTILRSLKGKNIHAKRFHSVLRPWSFHYAQLRNHRKLMLIDGAVGYFGGMNIRRGHLVNEARQKEITKDIHFKAKGPILMDLMSVFELDWYLATKETLDETWRPKEKKAGQMSARVLPNGPDEKFDKLRWILLGAVACAEKSISIMTPYFVPDETLISAISVASLRGVQVNILIPRNNNHKLVGWASMACMPQLLKTGCKVWLGGASFDHSKLLLVDEKWCMLGSSNWDARSFRLNFELNVDSTDKVLCHNISRIFKQKLAGASRLSRDVLSAQSTLSRLRNSSARLLGPYL